MSRTTRLVLATAAIVGSIGFVSTAANAVPSGSLGNPVSLSYSVDVPIVAEARAYGKFCSNTSSDIVIDGQVTFGSRLGLKLIFRNNVQGTKELTDLGELTIGLTGTVDPISIPRSEMRIGGNPYFAFRLNDPDSGFVDLGRCVQGATLRGNRSGMGRIDILGLLQAAECSNKGSKISFLADQEGEGIDGTLRITSTNKKQSTTQDALLSFSGFQEQNKGTANGAGGNPLIWVQLVQNRGNGWGTVNNPNTGLPYGEQFLGRCNKLGGS